MNNNNAKVIIGAIFIGLGILLIADNLNIFLFDLHPLIFSWRTIFIILGIVFIANNKNKTMGIIFLLIGGWGYAKNFMNDYLGIYFTDLWPILLLIAGLWLILNKNGKTKTTSFQDPTGNNPDSASKGEPSINSSRNTHTSDQIDESAIFSGIEKYIESQNFRGGKVTSIFGSCELDLTRCKLAPGENILEITTLFGGTELRVPTDWKIITSVTSVFGGFDDKRFMNFQQVTTDSILVIKGSIVFGGGELKS